MSEKPEIFFQLPDDIEMSMVDEESLRSLIDE